MRQLALLLFILLAGCETFSNPFSWGGDGATQKNFNYCNVPLRLMVIRTSTEYCRALGGHRVAESEVDELEAYYLGLTAN